MALMSRPQSLASPTTALTVAPPPGPPSARPRSYSVFKMLVGFALNGPLSAFSARSIRPSRRLVGCEEEPVGVFGDQGLAFGPGDAHALQAPGAFEHLSAGLGRELRYFRPGLFVAFPRLLCLVLGGVPVVFPEAAIVLSEVGARLIDLTPFQEARASVIGLHGFVGFGHAAPFFGSVAVSGR